MKHSPKKTFFLTTLLTFFIEVYCDCTFPNHKLPAADLKAYQKLKPLLGRRYSVEDPSHEYKYYVGICTDAIAGGEGIDSSEGVVQIKNVNNEKRVIGKYSSSGIMAGNNWVYLEYTGEQAYSSHCGHEQRKAAILFTCDPEATDNSPGMKMLEEGSNKTAGCYYLFELSHPEVCENKTSGASSLSIGSIILIVFFCVMSVYLIAGGLYQRFILGAKGVEQIPNYEFWKDFGNLQADGCDFVCRSRDARNSSPYKGLGDDQLEEPEERDDNLLPM